jgi:multiple sugar transport system permease protein
LHSLGCVPAGNPADGEGALGDDHFVCFHPELVGLRNCLAAYAERLDHNSGFYECAVDSDDRPDVRGESRSWINRRNPASRTWHPNPKVPGEGADFWGSEAMNAVITEHQAEALPMAARPTNNLAAQARRLGTWMILPAQLLLLFIVVFPLLMQIYISLTYWGPTDGVSWIYAYRSLNLFDNYVTFFSDGALWAAILRTLFIMAVAVPLEFVLGLGLATLFVDTFPGRRIFYSILLTPMMVVPAVAGYMFYMLFQSNGPINQILSFLTNSNVQLVWLSVPHLALVAVIAADVWQWTPLVFLILLAGILAVPEDQLKAAMMLGANWLQRFRRIVLPRMRTVITIVIILRLVESFKLFDVMFVMTRGGPGTATETISLYIYKQTFNELEWSYVAAIGLTLLVILSVLAVFGMRFMKHEIEVEKAMGLETVGGKTT